MKKVISAVLTAGMILTSAIGVSAAISPSYSAIGDYTHDAQGNKGWRYQYRDGGAYSSYVDMTAATEGTNWVVYTASGSVQNFISAGGNMQAKGTTVDNKTAFSWQAPYSGVVNLTAGANIAMAYNNGQKAPIEAGIAHTNANFELIDYQNEYDTDSVKTNDNYIWWYSIQPNDKVGTEPYNIDIEVSKGDWLFFEIGSTSATAATMVWKPVVTYKQAIEYTSGGTALSSVKDITTDGGTVNIETYSSTSLDANVYLMVYDAQNSLRDIKTLTQSGTKGTAEITMPLKNASETSYEGWSIKTFAITNATDRFFPVDISEKLILK